MSQYAFYLDMGEDSQVYFKFPKIPEIISALPRKHFDAMDVKAVQEHAEAAVWTALRGAVANEQSLPPGDKESDLAKAHGVVSLSLRDLCKLELLGALVATGQRSNAGFAKVLGTTEMRAIKLLSPATRPSMSEIEAALATLGKRLIVSVQTKPTLPSARPESLMAALSQLKK